MYPSQCWHRSGIAEVGVRHLRDKYFKVCEGGASLQVTLVITVGMEVGRIHTSFVRSQRADCID